MTITADWVCLLSPAHIQWVCCYYYDHSKTSVRLNYFPRIFFILLKKRLLALLIFCVIQGVVIDIFICIWLYAFKKQFNHAWPCAFLIINKYISTTCTEPDILAVLHYRMTSFKFNLELFEKYQTIGECIWCNGKV